jgi:hypothetical protein
MRANGYGVLLPEEGDGVPPSGVADQADGIPRSRCESPSPKTLLRLVRTRTSSDPTTAGSGMCRMAPKRRRRTVIGYTTTGDTTKKGEPRRAMGPLANDMRIKCLPLAVGGEIEWP